MNKTLITLAFLILILAAVVGDIVLAIIAPERIAAFNGGVITILGVGSAAIVTIYGLGKQGQQLEKIQSQTNGTLSKLMEENAQLRDQLAATSSTEQGRHEA